MKREAEGKKRASVQYVEGNEPLVETGGKPGHLEEPKKYPNLYCKIGMHKEKGNLKPKHKEKKKEVANGNWGSPGEERRESRLFIIRKGGLLLSSTSHREFTRFLTEEKKQRKNGLAEVQLLSISLHNSIGAKRDRA